MNYIKNPFEDIKILSELEAVNLVETEEEEKWNIVSIWSGGGGKHGNDQPEHKKAKTLCQHRFHDIETQTKDMILCNKEDIISILEYAKDHYAEKMIVHCHGGISRSSAFTFLILLDYYKDISDNPIGCALEELVSIKHHTLIFPNKYILSLGIHVICDTNTDNEIQWNRDLYNHPIFRLLYNF